MRKTTTDFVNEKYGEEEKVVAYPRKKKEIAYLRTSENGLSAENVKNASKEIEKRETSRIEIVVSKIRISDI